MGRLSRRKLLAGAAALAAGKVWPAHAADDVDVVIVGAGFAGLAAASRLTAAGRRVLVLEARERIGGRTNTEELPGGIRVDVGAQWIGPTQKRISRLAAELGAETFNTHDHGGHLLHDAGAIKKYSGTVPGLPGIFGFLSLASVGAAMWQLDRLAARLDLEKPWAGAKVRDLDDQTLAFWIGRHVPLAPARRLFEAGMRMVFAADSSQYSLLHALFYIRSAGDLNQLLAVRGAAQASRFKFGTADLARRLAAPFASSIRFGTPVRSIQQHADSVTVTAAGLAVRARRAIVAVPPPLVTEIDFSPGLSEARSRLLRGMPMGAVIKCMAVYPGPFWRDDGLSGQTVSTTGPITATYDNSVPHAKEGILLGFAAGSEAERLRKVPALERKRIALETFTRFFGPRAANPTHYTDHVWQDEVWSRGCYSALFPPGLWTAHGPTIRQPEGRIHWAGTETATEWHGYMEGAIQSGERAAQEVLAP